MIVNDMPCHKDSQEISGLRDALNSLSSGKLNRRQFMSVIIEWSYDNCFDKNSYMPKNIPSKPYNVRNIQSMSKSEFSTLDSYTKEMFFEELNEYNGSIRSIRNSNKSDYDWLLKMKSYYNYKGDGLKVRLIQSRIRLFNGLM